jgi:fumarate hydratase class II
VIEMPEDHESRIEHDSMGEVRVPRAALYGAQTQRALENFPISGIKPWPAFIWSMACVKNAAAGVNHALGLLDAELATAIGIAAGEIMEGRHREEFVVDPFQAGAGTSLNMNMNEVLANRATQILGGEPGEYLVHPNDHVNMSQSTNDTIPSAIRLGCLWRMEELLGVIGSLHENLKLKALEFDGVVKSGRTHLQDAVPVRLGQEFAAYAKAVERDRARIAQRARELARLGIGGTAAGTGLNAHPDYARMMVAGLRERTGLALELSDDLFESMQSMADMADFSASLRTLAITLTRIANDFRLLSSGPETGLDEIRLPAVQPGSSIMPGKVNPVMAEMLNMAMFHIIGCDTTVAYAAQAGQLELNVMMPIIGYNLFEMMQVAIGAVKAFDERAVRGLRANEAKASQWLERNPIIATALNPLIGYTAGAELVKEASHSGKTVREVALEAARRGELKHRKDKSAVKPDQIEDALSDLKRLTEGGILAQD